MVRDDLFLIDSTFLLKATETSFLGAKLLLNPDGQDQTRTFGFARDLFRLRNELGIRKAIIIFGQESMSVTSDEVLSDIFSFLSETKATFIRHDSAQVGEICFQLAPSARWILTANRAINQLVSDCLGILAVEDSGIPDSVTITAITNLGILPEQVPALLALSEGKDAPLKMQKAIRLLELYKSLDAILADCTTVPSSDWKRKLAQKETLLVKKEMEYRFRFDIQIAFPPVVGTLFDNSSENVNVLQSRGFCSLIRLLPLPDVQTINIEAAAQPKFDYRAIRSKEDLSNLEEILSKAELCAIDTEASDKDPMSATLYGISFSVSERQAFFVPMLKSDLIGLLPEDIRSWLNRILNKNLKLVGHNLKYDFALLKRSGIDVRPMYFDTMLAAYECFGDWDLWNLAAVSKKMLGVTIKRYKEIVGKGETFLDRPFAELVEHACCDADMALRLYGVLSRELRKRQIDRQFLDETMQLENLLLDRELTGVSLDIERIAAIAESIKNRVDLLKTSTIALADCDFDIDSLKSTTDILKKLGIWEKTARLIGEVQLEQLACTHPLPFLIVKYRRERNRYKEVEALYASAKAGQVFSKLSQMKSSHGCLWSGSPNLREAFVGQALHDIQLQQLFPCPVAAIEFLRDSSGDIILQDDLNVQGCKGDFIPCELGISGAPHNEILLSYIIGSTDASICRLFLISKVQAVKTRTALVLRYERLFEWLRQFTEHSISQGYAEYEGRRKYLAGLRSSDIDKRNKAVRAAIGWLVRY